MPINRRLLEILVCPITKLPLSMVTESKLDKLNALISNSDLQTMDGNIISESLQEALITTNNKMIYRIENDIPILLEDQGISVDQVEGW